MKPSIRRRLITSLAILPMAIFLYLLAAFMLGNLNVNRQQTGGSITLYIASNGIHTDLLVPSKNDIFDWTSLVNPGTETRAHNPTPAYLGIGWGEREFYLNTPTWKDLNLISALKAISGINQTLIHIDYYPSIPTENTNRIAFSVSPQNYKILVENIIADFARDGNNHVIPIPDRHYHDFDSFYAARGHYNLFNTCNSRVNNWLKTAGLPAVIWTPFSSPLLKRYRQLQPR